MAPKFALFTKGSKLPLNKGFKNMFELLQSREQPSNYVFFEKYYLDTLSKAMNYIGFCIVCTDLKTSFYLTQAIYKVLL